MDQPGVVGVGGRILPRWQEGCPRWFPPEFGWVVGTSIADARKGIFPVRNVWSGSMMVDREAFQKVDGFREYLSKVGGAARPEDTELCLRLSHVYGTAGQWLMVPSALVEHYVPAHRTTLRYVSDSLLGRRSGKGTVARVGSRPQSGACRRKDLLEQGDSARLWGWSATESTSAEGGRFDAVRHDSSRCSGRHPRRHHHWHRCGT